MYSQSAKTVEFWPDLSSGPQTTCLAVFPHREEWTGQLPGAPFIRAPISFVRTFPLGVIS